jgi:hypothetical protein
MPKKIAGFSGEEACFRVVNYDGVVKIHKKSSGFCNKMSKATCKMCKRAV